MTSPASNAIEFRISPSSINKHLFEVHMSIPATDNSDSGHQAEHEQQAYIELTLPAWIPGSYMIRDFAKNILQVQAHDSQLNPLEVHKTDKQTWRIQNDGEAVTFKYQVYAHDLSVRSAYICDEYAFFNGTSVFLRLVETNARAYKLAVYKGDAPSDWRLSTAMPLNMHQAQEDVLSADLLGDFYCDSYADLIDHPVLIGQYQHLSMEVLGTTFELVFTGDANIDLERIAHDLRPICEHHINLFGESPVHRYSFITLLCDQGFGGLEHSASTVLQFPRFDLPSVAEKHINSKEYQLFLSLCSHELFHTWHVKRNRPQALKLAELDAEVHTPQLWIYEGFTSFYDDLSLARCKLISPSRYCEILGEALTRMFKTQGRFKQTIAQSSFDAWTKFYKQDAASHSHITSYYNKGAMVALALDLTLRERSKNKVSLDSVMQALWQHYGSKDIGTHDGVIQTLCTEELGINVDALLQQGVHGTEDLPFADLLSHIGLALHMRPSTGDDDKGGTACPTNSSLNYQFGATLKEQAHSLLVQRIEDDSAANIAGLQLNDLVVAVSNWQASKQTLPRIISHAAQTGKSSITLHVLRDARLLALDLPIMPAVEDCCYLTIENEVLFEQWLFG